jgi:hypothetical protein
VRRIVTSPYVFLDQPIPILARQVIVQDYVAVHLKARPYVFDCRYEKPFETDVHLRVLEAFKTRGILPPAVLHRGVDVGATRPRMPNPDGGGTRNRLSSNDRVAD